MGRFNKWEIIGGIIAFGLAVIMICSLAFPPSKKHYNPSHSLHSQDTCKGLGVPVFPTPSNNKTHSDSEKTPDKEQWCADRSDLAAQWKTADITSTAFWAGALGIWLVGWTLIATRQATAVTRDASRRQLRCYLSKSDVKMGLSKKTNVIWIDIQNSGQTPASDIFATGQWFDINRPEVDKIGSPAKDIVVTDVTALKVDKISIVSTDFTEIEAEIPSHFIDNRLETRNNLVVSKYRLCVLLIKVYYTDIFDVRRVRRIGLCSKNMQDFEECENSERKVA